MAKPSGGKYDYCPYCKAKGYYTPNPLPAGASSASKVCKYCGSTDIKMTPTVPVKDVHTEHCCLKHGCMYGEPDFCTVERKDAKQSFPCEECDHDAERLNEIKDYLKKNLSISFTEWRDYYSHGLRVTVTLDGEEIASDSVSLPDKHWN